jgi:NTE family protein
VPADDTSPANVAIACQGGGSHTAFTAGALRRLLRDHGSDYRISALSGTSGGALCAFVTWYGLRTGGPEKARAALESLWERIAASSVPERAVNAGVVWNARLFEMGVPVPQFSPTDNVFAEMGQEWLRGTIESFVDGPSLQDLVVPDSTADRDRPLPPTLLVSAVDANDGSFDVFSDRPAPGRAADGGLAGDRLLQDVTDRLTGEPQPISVDAILASTAVPPLFDAVEIPNSADPEHLYWDGLLSQNPPVRTLLSGPEDAADKPDEIWLVRINPTRRSGTFDSLEEIADRRNELSGNISLEQELYFIRTVNRWVNEGRFADGATADYKRVAVRQIELDETQLDPPRRLRTASKLNRDRGFLEELGALGRRQADSFLSDVPAHTIVSRTPT